MKLKRTLQRTRDRGLFEKWFFNRGQSIWSDLFYLITITSLLTILVDKINASFGTNLDVGKVILFTPAIIILYWITGRVDFYILHIIQRENEIALIANPALYEKLCKILKDIEEIKTKVEELKK